jgi:hypothetical protein
MALLACQRCLICVTVQCGGNQLKKEKVVHHQFFVLSTGGELSWGKLSWGELSLGRVVPGARCPWGELSLGRVVYGVSCLWGELSMGRDVVGRVLWGELSEGRVVLGRVVREPILLLPVHQYFPYLFPF